jgi:hypothetical protein
LIEKTAEFLAADDALDGAKKPARLAWLGN